MNDEKDGKYQEGRDYLLSQNSSTSDRRVIPALVLLADELHALTGVLRERADDDRRFQGTLPQILRNRLP